MLPIMTENKIISVGAASDTSLNDPAKYPYQFGFNPLLSVQTDILAGILKAKGFHKVGLVFDSSAQGASRTAAYQTSLKAVGLTPIAVTYPSTALDITAQMSQLAASKPDVVIFGGISPQLPALILNDRLKVGLTNVPFYADGSVAGDLYDQVSASARQNVSLFTNTVNVKPAGGNPPALASFLAQVGETTKFEVYALAYTGAYDEIQTLNLGATLAKSTDPDAMKTALESGAPLPPNVTSLTYNTIKFSPTDHFNTGVTSADMTLTVLGPQSDGQFHAP
jgi:branched-chain amino acid transport system substrate-binding protein